MNHLHIYSGAEDFAAGAAALFTDAAAAAIRERGRFTVALSGGGTPRPVYTRLASPEFRERVDWPRVQIFFGDERCVPPDDARSNYQMARETLFDPVVIPPTNVHRMHGEDDPAQAALCYEQELAQIFRTPHFPSIDLVLLGLGDNGHTASLFPGTAVLRERERWAVAQYVEVAGMWRVTLTAPLINAARKVVFLVDGAAKAEMLFNVQHGPYQPDVWPAQMIDPTNGELHWVLDAAAAARLSGGPEMQAR